MTPMNEGSDSSRTLSVPENCRNHFLLSRESKAWLGKVAYSTCQKDVIVQRDIGNKLGLKLGDEAGGDARACLQA